MLIIFTVGCSCSIGFVHIHMYFDFVCVLIGSPPGRTSVSEVAGANPARSESKKMYQEYTTVPWYWLVFSYSLAFSCPSVRPSVRPSRCDKSGKPPNDCLTMERLGSNEQAPRSGAARAARAVYVLQIMNNDEKCQRQGAAKRRPQPLRSNDKQSRTVSYK